MRSLFEDIKEFHTKFALEYDGKPRTLSPSVQKFRVRFMREELKEYLDAVSRAEDAVRGRAEPSFDDEVAHELEHMLDALVDLTYVVLGTAYLHGFDFEEAWARVHAANMGKVRAARASESKRKSKNDVVKPPGWKPPRHRDLVFHHAHKG
jgi:predicted HAD superfamily Cof-like phosphohydrolase